MASDQPAAPSTRLRTALLAIAACLLAVAGVFFWLLCTTSGARAVFAGVEAFTAGAVAAKGIDGRVIGPLRVENVTLDTPENRLAVSDLQLDWRPSALMHKRLHLTKLHASRLEATAKVEKPPEPPKLPERIALPLMLQAEDVQLNRIELVKGAGKPVVLGPLAFGIAFDDHLYRLDLRGFSAAHEMEKGRIAARFRGQATLSVAKPYALEGSFSSDSQAALGERTFGAAGKIDLTGSLDELTVDVDLGIDQAGVEGRVQLRPFTGQPLGKTQLAMRSLDLSRFDAELPGTALHLDLSAEPDGAGTLRLRNAEAGMVDERKIPLLSFDAAFRQESDHWIFHRIDAVLGTAAKPAGKIGGSGRYDGGALSIALRTERFDLKRVDRRLHETRLDGQLELRHADSRQEFSLSLSEPFRNQRLALAANGAVTGNRMTLDRIDLQAGQGRLEASGYVSFAGTQSFDAKGRISRFRLQELGNFPQLPALELNGWLDLRGARLPSLEADLAFRIDDSRLAGHPLTGEGNAELRGERLRVPRFVLASGPNRLNIEGLLSDDSSRLAFALDAPQLRQLGPSFGGALHAAGTVRGTMMRPHIDAQWTATNAKLPYAIRIDAMQGQAEIAIDRGKPFIVERATAGMTAKGLHNNGERISAMSAQVQFAPQANAALSLSLQAEGIATGRLLAERLSASANGTTSSHAVEIAMDETGQTWRLKGTGGLNHLDNAPSWRGSIDAFDAGGRINARLVAPATLLASAERVQLDHLRLDTEGGSIDLEQFARDEHGIATRGRLEHLQVSQLLRYSAPKAPLKTDLQLGGEWDIRIGDTFAGAIEIRREQGDLIVLGGAPVTLGLHTLRANATVNSGLLALQMLADGNQLGRIEVVAGTVMGNGGNRLAIAPEAPVSGSMRIDVPSLAWIGPMLSANMSANGRLHSDVVIGGTFAQPQLSGRIGGEALKLAMTSIGLDLREGTLDGEFHGDQLQLRSLRFQGAQGAVEASGPVNLGGGTISAQLGLHAERFTLLNRSDRRFVVSGDTRLDWHDRRGKLSGALKVDSGFVDLGESGKPELSDDVVVVGQEKKQGTKTAVALDIALSLGEGVTITGRGLNAVLGGEIRVLTDAGETLQAQGAFHVVKGTYTAYGNELAVEQGALRFRGPIANPALDILAMRRGQEVEAGVAVRGNVLTPRVTLVSEPAVPDADKLSWLVLGRGLSAAGESDAGTLQSAASALLSEGAKAGVQSSIGSAIGLDTFNVGTSQDSLQQHIVTLGKRLSSKLYVGYQQGLESAASVVQMRYALTPKLSVEAEAGTRSAISLLYSIAFD